MLKIASIFPTGFLSASLSWQSRRPRLALYLHRLPHSPGPRNACENTLICNQLNKILAFYFPDSVLASFLLLSLNILTRSSWGRKGFVWLTRPGTQRQKPQRNTAADSVTSFCLVSGFNAVQDLVPGDCAALSGLGPFTSQEWRQSIITGQQTSVSCTILQLRLPSQVTLKAIVKLAIRVTR